MRLFEGTPFDRPLRCEQCGELDAQCSCRPAEKELTPPEKQTAILSTEKRKKGKLVTVVRGLASSENDLSALLLRLKTVCGAGGTLKEDCIEIQGSHLDRVGETLKKTGYRIS
ncbi:MAG: translation initiation factor [Planctomycetaceae bacterium]|nr:translation initiation factor [Planctomycetaceae bacterium]